MSGTRSHSPKAPVTEALIVAHGQPSDPEPAEAALRVLAGRVGRRLPGWRVRSATMAAPGVLEREIAQVETPPLVFPMFMSDGWFTDTALPARLAGTPARILAPFGTSRSLPALATADLLTRARERRWPVDGTEILIVAHGSASGRTEPADCTYRFARSLSAMAPWHRVRVGFLEQAPRLSRVSGLCGPRTLCLPFFAADGQHVQEDIPEDLRAGGFQGVICASLGRAEFAPMVIADALRGAAPDLYRSEVAA